MTSTQSSDVMAVDEEKKDSSLMKKRKAEEKESESESESESENEGESESESEVDEGEEEDLTIGEVKLEDGRVRVFNGCLRFTYVPEPEPQWDVDSFDERGYESDPKVRACFSDDNEYAEYRNERIEAFESKGFKPDPSRHIRAIQNLEGPSFGNVSKRQYLAKIATLCVDKLNKEKKTTVEFDSVVRGNMSGGGRWKLYITFMAKEYPNGPLVEYQAKAMDFAGESQPPFPILCRPSPKSLSKPIA